MASNDQLWFEMGVRDNVSGVLKDVMNETERLSKKMSQLSVNFVSEQDTSAIRKQIDAVGALYARIQELQKKQGEIPKNWQEALNVNYKKYGSYSETMEVFAESLRRTKSELQQLKSAGLDVENFEKHLDALNTTYEKFAAMQSIDIGKKLGLAHLRGYTGPATAATDKQWNEMMRQAEIEEVAGEAAKRHEKKLIELTRAFDSYYAHIEKSKRVQDADNRARQESVRTLRLQSEELVRSRREMLQNQASQLRGLLSKGRDGLGVDNYNAVRDALKGIRAEMRQLDSMLSSIKSFSINDLFSAGRGQLNYAPLISNVNSVLNENAQAERRATQAAREHAQQARDLSQLNRRLASSYKEVSGAANETNRVVHQMALQVGTYFSLFGAERLLRSIVEIGGQFEVQHVALQNILGDVQEANTLFQQLQGLAVESPKTFQELTTYAKQLSAYQIPASELYDTTKRLADMSSGLGVDMNRLILAYGQVRSAAVLRGQELRQFTEAGIPMVQALADKFTEMNGKITTTADVFQLISKRAVPFEMVRDVLWDMTSQGGKFFNMQAELADTLYGKWQKLQDQWQITLGHIADGKSAAGSFMKTVLEGLVGLTRAFDSFMPMLGMFAAGKLGQSLWGMGRNAVYGANGMTAIRNMELTKLKEANRLERERVMYGRVLNQQEQELVNKKKILTANEMQLLLLEGQITERQLMQLANAGKLDKLEVLKLLHAQGYTIEQIRQINNGNLQLLQGGESVMKRIGSGLLGFFGGLPGIIMTALGAAFSIFSYFQQQSEALEQKGEAMMDHAQQRANTLAKSLTNVTAEGTIEQKIEVLEESLLQLGSTGQSIVASSREHMDDIGKRWEILKSGAESYEKVLQSIGTQTGKALFEKALDDSGIEKALQKYDNAVNDMFKRHSGLERYSDLYEKAIAEVVKANKQLADQMKGRSLFDQIDIAGQERLQKAITSLKNDNNFGLISAANEALGTYFNLQERVKAKWEEITNESIPAMSDELKAAAREIGITKFDQLTSEQKQSLEALTREYVNSIEGGSVEAKNRLAEELASQVFHIKIVGDLTIDTTKMSGFANYVWGKFGGNNQPQVNDINLPMFPWQTKQVGGNNTQKVKIGNMSFTRQQVANIFEDIDKFAKDYNSRVDNLNTTIKRLHKSGAADAAKDAEAERNDLLSVLNALGLREDNTTGKNRTGGSKKDSLLEAAKTQLEEIKDFYSEYEKYREQYGEEKGLDLVTNIFGMDEERARYIVKNYENEIRKIIKSIEQNGDDARKKFAINGWKLLGEFKLKDDKAKLQKAVEELQRYLQDETSKWNLYKSLLDKTGSKEFAMSAFVDGVEWDDVSRNMAERLKESMATRKLSFTDSIFDMDQDEAEKFFGKNSAELKLWEEIVKSIRKNWTDGLNDIAEATSKLMTTEDKIVKAERELAELRGKYGKDDPRVIAKERELDQFQADAFEQSEPYLKFYSAIFSMTIDEAEKMGVAIKKNLVDQLSKGGVNADKFLKSIRNVDQQLEKIRSRKSFFETFSSGGFSAVAEQNYEDAFGAFSVAAQRVADAEEKRDAARIKAAQAITEEEKKAARYAIIRAEVEKTVSEQQLKEAKARLDGAITQVKLSAKFSRILGEISSVLDVMTDAYDSWREMAEAVDGDVKIDAWAEDMFSIFSSTSNGIQKLQSGDIFGALTSTVFGSITALSKNHDARLQKKIENSQRMVRALTNEYQDLQDAMERALGGIYTTGGYDEMYDNLKKQRDEIQKQQDLEYEKKNTDKDKIADYDQQLKELDETMKNYALDMAKMLYDIDLHSWASELTDAIVGAWEKGDDAAEAYREKVKDIMKDLTKNILAKKVMEKAFANLGIDEIIANMMDASSGKLDETAIPRLAEALGQAGNLTVDAITKTLDAMEANGTIEREASSSKSSTSNTIKGITENTADLLASYINAIRADVSVNRMTLTEILSAVQGQSELPVIAQAQLLQLEQISSNTLRNALAAEMIYDILHSNVLGNEKFNVK